jgi:hypothetical protein
MRSRQGDKTRTHCIHEEGARVAQLEDHLEPNEKQDRPTDHALPTRARLQMHYPDGRRERTVDP